MKIPTLALLPYLAMFVAMFGFWYFYTKKKKEALEKLLGHLSGYVVKFSYFPTLNGEYQGLKFSIVLIPPSKNSPRRLKISLTKDSPFKFSVYKEGLLSNLGERLGIVREVKIEDASFDQEFLIFSNDPTQAMVYFSGGTIKNSIKELLYSGFGGVLANGKEIVIQKQNYAEADIESGSMIGVLQKLVSLSRGL